MLHNFTILPNFDEIKFMEKLSITSNDKRNRYPELWKRAAALCAHQRICRFHFGLDPIVCFCASAISLHRDGQKQRKRKEEIAIITVTWCEQSEWIYVKLNVRYMCVCVATKDTFLVSRYQKKKKKTSSRTAHIWLWCQIRKTNRNFGAFIIPALAIFIISSNSLLHSAVIEHCMQHACATAFSFSIALSFAYSVTFFCSFHSYICTRTRNRPLNDLTRLDVNTEKHG